MEAHVTRDEVARLSEAMMPACYRWCQNRVYECGKILHPEEGESAEPSEQASPQDQPVPRRRLDA